MAFAFALLGLVRGGLRVSQPDAVAKSWPEVLGRSRERGCPSGVRGDGQTGIVLAWSSRLQIPTSPTPRKGRSSLPGAPAISARTRSLCCAPAACRPSSSTTSRRATARPSRLARPFVEADLADRGAIAAAFQVHKPSAVIHFAAKAYVGESVTDPAKYYRENVIYTWNLLEEMRVAGVPRHRLFVDLCDLRQPGADSDRREPSAGSDQSLREHQAAHGTHDAGLRTRLRPALRSPALLQRGGRRAGTAAWGWARITGRRRT